MRKVRSVLNAGQRMNKITTWGMGKWVETVFLELNYVHVRNPKVAKKVSY